VQADRLNARGSQRVSSSFLALVGQRP
jgi:hypothetical protein